MLPRTSTLPSASDSGSSQMHSITVKCLFRLILPYQSYVLTADRGGCFVVVVIIIIIIIIINSSSVLNSALDPGAAIFL